MVAALLFAAGVGAVGEFASEEPSDVPMPGPGAKARYAVTPLGTGDDFGVQSIEMSWGAGEFVRDEAFNVRLAWPVHVTVTGTEWSHRLWTLYDAETGKPLFDGQETIRPYRWPTSNFFGVSTGSQSAELELAFELYEDIRGFCGLLDGPGLDLKQDEVMLTGHCSRLDGEPETLFQQTGPLEYTSPEDERFQVHYQAGLPFPTRLTVPIADMLLWMGWTDVVWQLDLEEWSNGGATYGFAPSLTEAGALPAQRPLTPWTLDDSRVDHPFPLSAATRLIIANNDDTADFLAAHPEAYLQAAWSLRERDGSGNYMHTWALTWTDGDAWHAKKVRQQPGGLFGVTSEELPDQYIYEDHEPGHVERPMPPKSSLPETMPDPRDVMDRHQEMTGGTEPLPRYGFQFYCDQGDCNQAIAIVAGGDFTADRFDRGSDPQANANVMTDGYHYGYHQLMVLNDGTIAYTEKSRSQTAALLPDSSDDPAPVGQDKAASGWVAPTPGQAARVGLIAAASGLLVYLAPALKAPMLGLFSRIRGEHLLQHPARAAIMSAVEAEPGIHFQELLRRLDLGRSTLDHHLGKLSQGGLMRAKVSPGYTCYFPRKADRNLMDAAPFLRAPGPKAILQEVVHGNDGRVSAISKRTGLSTSTVSHHLGRMKDAGLVEGGGRRGFRPTAKASNVI